ncbi:MAG: Ig-like domain-containing protein [Erysipelotrichaceae bacterium]
MAISKGDYPQTWLKLQNALATGKGWKHPDRNEVLKCEKGADNKYPTLTGIVQPVLVSSITANPTSVELAEDGTATFTYTVLPENATDKSVTVTSDNTEFATVAVFGLGGNIVTVTGVSVGETTITLFANDGSRAIATVNVTVRSAEVEVG